jgi:hypothetical protein
MNKHLCNVFSPQIGKIGENIPFGQKWKLRQFYRFPSIYPDCRRCRRQRHVTMGAKVVRVGKGNWALKHSLRSQLLPILPIACGGSGSVGGSILCHVSPYLLPSLGDRRRRRRAHRIFAHLMLTLN